MSKHTVVLVILDGWGIGRNDSTNPIHVARPQAVNHIKSHYQCGALQASGIAVGLPWGEEGNSEAGHLTIGAGKKIYQHLPRVTLSIKDGSFTKNKVFLNAINHAIKKKSAVNLIGLVSEGNVHSSLKHLDALIDLVKSTNSSVPIKLHVISDGRDSSPQSFLKLLPRITSSSSLRGAAGTVAISSLSGRYFAMDRDKHWDRTQEAYKAIIGKGEKIDDLVDYIKSQYKRGLSDEHLPPVSVGSDSDSLANNDSVIFFNFREDRMRQLTTTFIQKKDFKNIHYAAMTKYSDKSPIPAAFPTEIVDNPLGKVLAKNNKLQLRVAETEKYAHVTYFFNGLATKPMKNEYRILIPSRNVARHDQYPEMMAMEIADRVIQAMEEREMDFILVNFANPDMIAHTGNFDAAVSAIKTVDEQIEKIVQTALATDATLIVTSDHGNVERMMDPITGAVETKHDANPVPFYLIGKKFESHKNSATVLRSEREPVGVLSDIAPTILKLMKVVKPKEMTGESLIGRLY